MMSNLLHCWDRPLASPIIHARKKWPPQSGDGNKASLFKCLISLLTIRVIWWQCGSQHTPCRFLKMPRAVSTLKVQQWVQMQWPASSDETNGKSFSSSSSTSVREILDVVYVHHHRCPENLFLTLHGFQ